MKIRREKGLCYSCDDKYAPGHKYKAIFFLLVEDEEAQDSVMMEELGEEDDTTGDIVFVVPEVSMHTLADHNFIL